MRSLIEAVLLSAIVALAWEKPISERVGDVIPALASNGPVTQPVRATPVAANSFGLWMWDENRKSVLDRPAYSQTAAFTNHVYYADNHGRRFWVDAQGKRHYEE